MSLVELIGFAISLIALSILFFNNQRAARQQAEIFEKEEEEEKEDNPLRNLLDSIDRPPPKPTKKAYTPLEKHKLKSSVENRRLKSRIEERKIASELVHRYEKHNEIKRERVSRALKKMASLHDLQDMVIYFTIFDRPKGLKNLADWEKN